MICAYVSLSLSLCPPRRGGGGPSEEGDEDAGAGQHVAPGPAAHVTSALLYGGARVRRRLQHCEEGSELPQGPLLIEPCKVVRHYTI